jgi:MATE family multidrug resistance protein
MSGLFQKFGQDLWPMLSLAWPVVAAELGWMSMGVVDTMMVGRVSAEAIGAVSIGSVLFFSIAIFGMGLLLGLDTLVSQAFGAGNLRECHQWLVHGAYLSLILSPLLTVLIWLFIPLMSSWGIHSEVLRQTIPFLKALTWGLLPLLLYASLRRYLQAMSLVKPVMVVLVTANLVNAAGNWVLIYGHLGVPAMGAEGSGWSTCLARFYMAGSLLAYILYYERQHQTGLLKTSLMPSFKRISRLFRLGLPAAMQITLEVGVFAAATTLAGKLEPTALAAHQIALNLASLTFMVPLGVASAGAVRVGQAIGRRDPHGAASSGWTALCLGAGFMLCAGMCFLLLPHLILRAFTLDTEVISIGASLLLVAAVFQLFDGLQVVATGVLRGTGDTRTPMVYNLVGHWLLGLPVGYALCFIWGEGIVGLWIGLSIGLILVGVALLWVWSRKVVSLKNTAALARRC